MIIVLRLACSQCHSRACQTDQMHKCHHFRIPQDFSPPCIMLQRPGPTGGEGRLSPCLSPSPKQASQSLDSLCQLFQCCFSTQPVICRLCGCSATWGRLAIPATGPRDAKRHREAAVGGRKSQDAAGASVWLQVCVCTAS